MRSEYKREGRKVWDINELIGIVKGINFDGIINEKEVMRLQAWVDKHRNLVYEQQYAELISIVDAALEDQIIDNEERDTLLKYCEKVLSNTFDETAKIYELNGIIEGIICDGEINEKEIYRLSEWMKENRNIIQDHKPTESLCKMIDSILADGIVTEKEREQLLEMLSARIAGSQFETKLEYLKKQVKEKKNIGIDLIDILDNENAIEEIHRRAEVQLKKAYASYTGVFLEDQEIVFISLVLIAMLHYDGNYYAYVRTTYSDLFKQCVSEQRIEGLIRTILNRFRSREDRDSKARIINVALSNAIVPRHFLRSFFEFIFDIYKLNFEYDLSDDLSGDFRFVYEGLRNNMLSDTDEVKVNVTRKTYKLIKTTKELIANEKNIDAVIKLSIIIVKLIDKKIWDKETVIFNPYLRRGYEEWVETLREEKGNIQKRTTSGFHSRWEPKFILQQNEVFLVPPVHRIKAKYNYCDIKVVVKHDNKVIYINTRPDIREIIGGYQVIVDQIKLNKPIGKIVYQLWAENEIIYNSGEKLYKPFIVFDEQGNEIRNNTDYSGTAIFCISSEDFNFKPYFTTENYSLISQNVKMGETCIIGEKVFSFSSMTKSGVIGEKWDNYGINEIEQDVYLEVFKNVKYFVFEVKSEINKIVIFIDGKIQKFDDKKCNITESKGAKKYIIALEDIKDGIHKIEVFAWDAGVKNKILGPYRFAVDKDLEHELLKLNDDTYFVSVHSGLLESPVMREIQIKEYDENSISFEYQGRMYGYQIPFDFEAYRVSGQAWMPLKEDIWVGDIRQDSILDIFGTEIDELQVYGNNGECITETLKLKSRGVYKQVPVGFLVSYKMTYDYVVLVFLKDGQKQKGIFCYNRCILNGEKTEIKYNPLLHSLDIFTTYYGKGNVYVSITDRYGKEVYRSQFLAKGKSENIYNLMSFENYTVSFYEKEKGLSLRKDHLLKSYNTIFYAREDFVGRSFKIVEVQFDQVVKGDFLRKSYYFNKVYVRFLKQVDGSIDLFKGEIYVQTRNGIFRLYNINPVDIEICSDVIDGTMELSITKERDGLLLDFEHHGIMNTTSSDKAIDIFSYTIDMDGGKAL